MHHKEHNHIHKYLHTLPVRLQRYIKTVNCNVSG
jgi:hypothetical protein